MDPDEALKIVREGMAKAISDTWNAEVDELDWLDRTAEAFQGLDEWLCRGGFLPTDWNKYRKETQL